MTFKLIKTYHKPYRIFHDPYVINIGNVSPTIPNIENVKWLRENMDFCPITEKTAFNSSNSEWTIWSTFVDKYSNLIGIDGDTHYISFQHYSKILDLNTVSDQPYHDYTHDEDQAGSKYRDSVSLDEFGYNKINEYLQKYDVIVGNQYPCNILNSIHANMKLNYNDVIQQYLIILKNYNDPLFTPERLLEYCSCKYQYWRGGPLIAPIDIHKRLLDFTVKFEHSFIDSKMFTGKDNEIIFKNNDGRSVGYLGEMVIGFAIYCYIDECLKYGKKIGYSRLYTDANVIFGNTKL